VDGGNEERRRSRFRSCGGQPPQLSFEFLLALTYMSHLIRELGKGALQMTVELIQRVLDGFTL
jgi:hypothetical protein